MSDHLYHRLASVMVVVSVIISIIDCTSCQTVRFGLTELIVDEDEEDVRDRARAMRKREVKDKRQRDELVLDEVAPKETGREAQLAKKRAQNAYHKRERSPNVELNESDLYGDDRSR
jgi:hypothetical protein